MLATEIPGQPVSPFFLIKNDNPLIKLLISIENLFGHIRRARANNDKFKIGKSLIQN
jgi:hypothetical protein